MIIIEIPLIIRIITLKIVIITIMIMEDKHNLDQQWEILELSYLVNVHITNWNNTMFFHGKTRTISLTIFNEYQMKKTMVNIG